MSRVNLLTSTCEKRWARRPLSLGDASGKLRRYSGAGTNLDRDEITDYVDRSPMLVTMRSPHIGYDEASPIAHKADYDGTACARQPLPWSGRRQTSSASLTRARWSGSPRRDRGLERDSQ